jgi:Protein of unknown function (DUF1351)
MSTEQVTIVTEYNPVAAALQELRDRYAGVIFPVDTKEGMSDAKDVKRRLTKLRTGLEALRVEIKAPALKRTQAIDAEAKAITAAIKAIEDPISQQIKIEEDRIEAEKEAKAEIERARIAAITEKIKGLRSLPLALAGESSDAILAELQALAHFEPSEAAFAEFTAECDTACHEVIGELHSLYERIKVQEDAAAAVEIERARIAEAQRVAAEELAIERAAMQAERDAMARERAELAEARAAMEAAKVLPVVGMDKHPNGTPMYSTTTFKDNGEPIMLNANGTRSVFCDINDDVEGEKPAEPEFTIHDKTDELPVQMLDAEPATDWSIRQFAIATADQFAALAGKVALCGELAFSTQLFEASGALREGKFDAAMAGANTETLVQFDNDLIDATVNAIDALGGGEVQAAA